MVFSTRFMQILLFCALFQPIQASALHQVWFHGVGVKTDLHPHSIEFTSLDDLKRQLVISLPGQAGWRAQALLLKELATVPHKIFAKIDSESRKLHLIAELEEVQIIHVEDLLENEQNILELITMLIELDISPTVLTQLYRFFYQDDYQRFENFLGVALLQLDHHGEDVFSHESVLDYKRIRNSWIKSISSK